MRNHNINYILPVHILARQGMRAIASSYGFKRTLQLFKRAQTIWEKDKITSLPLSAPQF